ncbi:TerB family tellurite resistance protein [Aliiglaciecola sp. LCG003]|uniref:tellurite resistance TerB family protein n=1 Tax=Aliiglaciecola sp. LCG003 TaxID=3053655 RepID=UPI0025726139|nr:TerB family tellurite resistance protein [Aliiglaciecola sp. LCG003]WJG09375.1 TerB family tellurite resistance protein [Aliiglaciecola sp. LCG003]
MEQAFNEALLKLCMLMYRIDGKITLTEQDYFQSIYSHLDWQGEQDLDEFQRQSIHQVRQAVDSGEVKAYILSLKDALTFNAKKALTVAQGISLVDGDIAEEEQEILDYLQNRLLAKALD